jgi:hypothetical protein
MNPQESCQAAELRLQTAQQLLLDPRPGTLDQSLEVLSQVIEILERLAAGSPRDWDPAVHVAFDRIKAGAANLRLQVDHGSNLIRGLMQLRFGEGYTRGGLPEFAQAGAERLFEA